MARPRDGVVRRRLSTTVDEKIYARLEALSYAQNVSMAWLIRHAISDLLDRNDSDSQVQLPLRRAHN